MLCRLFLVALVAFSLNSPAQASLVRVEFTAELEKVVPEGQAAPFLHGHVLFAESPTEFHTDDPRYSYSFAELVEFSVTNQDFRFTSETGIVRKNRGYQMHLHYPGPLNGTVMTVGAGFAVGVGQITNSLLDYIDPSKLPPIDPSIPPNDIIDRLWSAATLGHTVSSPDATIYLEVTSDREPLTLESLQPPSLDQLVFAQLSLYLRETGVSQEISSWPITAPHEARADYRITSLTVVPEPRGLVLLGCCVISLLVAGRTAFSS